MTTRKKVLNISPGRRIYVLDTDEVGAEGLAPENANEMLEFLGVQLMIEPDVYKIMCDMFDKFGKANRRMEFAWALLCGYLLSESMAEAIDIAVNADEDEIDGTAIPDASANAGMYQ